MENMYISERTAPSMLRYSQMTPLSFEAKQEQRLYYPSNQSTYSGIGNNIIRIPISSGSAFLDGSNSYLKLSFQNTCAGANTYTFSNSFHSLIDRVRVISASGQELEYIINYNHLHCALADLLLSPEKRQARLQEGYSQMGQAAFTNLALAANPDNAAINTGVNNVLGNMYSDPLQMGCKELTVTQNGFTQVYIPLELSQIVGANKKLMPLFLTGEITLEITLAQYPCMVSDVAQPLTYQISNVFYCASTVEFGGSVNQALTTMVASSGLFLHATCWRSQLVALAANQNQWINTERLKSVKSVLVTFSDPSYATTANRRPTNRNTNSISSLQLKIGSDYYPTQPLRADSNDPKTCGLYLNETFHSLGVYNDINHTSLVNTYNFAANEQTAKKVGRAVYGIELDAFGREAVESGINTIVSNPITFIMENSAGNLNAYSHLLFDCIFTIQPDGQFVAVR